ncbi:MAG TPA: Gfo/Idh/MocA family oxidoreductase [Bryobacteraceae bacterium]|nr:Gfo/Idh/MocA family oxidoreductase [Bryobacteraceae bacterium]
MTGTKLRGVGIGAGYFARFHYEAWSRIPEVEIAAVCDLDPGKAQDIAQRHRIPFVSTEWRDTIDAVKPDFIDIITGPAAHEEICADAARRGIAVICQKPLAPDLPACERIVENARASGIRFMVHENWRWQPWYRKIAELRHEESIGDFVHLYFRMRTGDGWPEDAYLARQPFFREYPRLLVYETGIHFIDTFRFLMGEVTEVFARLRQMNPGIRGEDAGQIFFTFANGSTAVLDASRYNESEAANPRYTFGELRIDGTRGHLTMTVNGDLRLKQLGQPAIDVEYEHEDVNFAGDCVYALQRHFTTCIRTGQPFESEGEDYIRSIRVMEAAYESAASGVPVRL